MKAAQIRRKARTVLKNLSGKYQLFLLPIILAVISTNLAIRETILNVEGFEIKASANNFPLLITLLLTFFLASASFTILDVLRYKRQKVSFSDSNRLISENILGKFLVLTLLKWVYLFLYSLIWMIGYEVMLYGVFIYSSDSTSTVALLFILIGLIIYLGGLVLFLVKSLAYSIAEYLLYDQLTTKIYTGARDLLKKSQQLMKGYKWKLFCLELSFIGWYFLVAITFGLAYVYVLPYQTTARLIFYNNLKQVEQED